MTKVERYLQRIREAHKRAKDDNGEDALCMTAILNYIDSEAGQPDQLRIARVITALMLVVYGLLGDEE